MPQLPTWKGEAGVAVAPWPETIVEATACGLQLVGFSMKAGRSAITWIWRYSSGTPCSSCGIVLSEVIVSCAVIGSIWIEARTTAVPRLNGPACTGTFMIRL